LPNGRQQIFMEWVEEKRLRERTPSADAPLEPELALCALSTTPRLTSTVFSVPPSMASSTTVSPDLTPTISPLCVSFAQFSNFSLEPTTPVQRAEGAACPKAPVTAAPVLALPCKAGRDEAGAELLCSIAATGGAELQHSARLKPAPTLPQQTVGASMLPPPSCLQAESPQSVIPGIGVLLGLGASGVGDAKPSSNTMRQEGFSLRAVPAAGTSGARIPSPQVWDGARDAAVSAGKGEAREGGARRVDMECALSILNFGGAV